MAKKTVAPPPAGSFSIDTGIYLRRRIALKQGDPEAKAARTEEENEEAKEAVKKQINALWLSEETTTGDDFSDLRKWLVDISKCGDWAAERDARSAALDLSGVIKMLAEIEAHVGRDSLVYRRAVQLVEWSQRLGRIIEQINIRAVEPIALAGRKAKIDHPIFMRDEKKRTDEENRLTNQKRAKDALKWAREHFPTAAEDNKISRLKAEAAKHVNISPRQFNRWLSGK